MKKNIFILPLLAISALSGCVWETKQPYSLATDTSIEEGPKDERIEAQVINDSYYKFYLPEFKEAFVSSNIQISSRLPSLSYGETLISEGALSLIHI